MVMNFIDIRVKEDITDVTDVIDITDIKNTMDISSITYVVNQTHPAHSDIRTTSHIQYL